MKILLYFENEKMLKTSGIGRAREHQIEALTKQGIDFSLDPDCEDYDILHVNTYGPMSMHMISKAKKANKKVIVHAHSTEEDFRDSFILSNKVAPIFKKRLINIYSQGDLILTPTLYSKKLLEGYGLDVEIISLSNGIDLQRFSYDKEKVKAFRRYFSLKEDEKVIISVGLYFERKGLLDFIEVAKRLPQYRFIWFGYTPLYSVPKKIREAVVENHPKNVYFPGYVKGAIIEGAYQGCDAFLFLSKEETEGIVVLEALASEANIIVRDIKVFDSWLIDKKNCYKGKDIDSFVKLVEDCVSKKLHSTCKEARVTAEQRSIEEIGKQLRSIYENVLKK